MIKSLLCDPARLLDLIRNGYLDGPNFYVAGVRRLQNILTARHTPHLFISHWSEYGAKLWLDTQHLDGQPHISLTKGKVRWREIEFYGLRLKAEDQRELQNEFKRLKELKP